MNFAIVLTNQHAGDEVVIDWYKLHHLAILVCVLATHFVMSAQTTRHYYISAQTHLCVSTFCTCDSMAKGGDITPSQRNLPVKP